MIYTVKLRLKPTKSQKTGIFKMFGLHKTLYNRCLEHKIKQYEETKTSDSRFDQIKKEIPAFKSENPDVSLYSYSSFQQTVRRLHKTYDNFFRKDSSFPRFKKIFKSVDFGAYGDGWKIRNGQVYIKGIGEIDFFTDTQITNPQHLTLKFDGDFFYACITENKTRPVIKSKDASVGIDFGMKHFITLSDGTKIDHPLPYLNKLKKQARIQQQIAKAKENGNAIILKKKRRALRKTHRKTANQRMDFAHKLSKKLASDYNKIAIEDLSIEKLDSFSTINRKLRDLAWCQFTNFLQYKAANAGIVLVKVNPAYTSQECICGKLVPKTLKERVHKCPCGHIEDRDILAAKNILKRGFPSKNFSSRTREPLFSAS